MEIVRTAQIVPIPKGTELTYQTAEGFSYTILRGKIGIFSQKVRQI